MTDWADEKANDLVFDIDADWSWDSQRAGSNAKQDATHAIAAALREARAMGEEWRDIGTAPKDGSWMLLAKIVGHPDHPTSLWWACRGHWSTKWNNWSDGIEPCGLAGPTHYLLADGHGVRQPLPAAPKES